MKMKRMKKILAILMVLSLQFVFAACGSKNDPPVVDPSTDDAQTTTDKHITSDEIIVGYAMKTLQEERWQRELDGCKAAAEDLGVTFLYQVANGDAQTQLSQIENMVTQGVDVLMVTCVDMGSLTNVLDSVREAGVKIIIYDNPVSNAYGDAFVGYEDYTNGRAIASICEVLDVKGNVALLHGDKASSVEELVRGEKDKKQNCPTRSLFYMRPHFKDIENAPSSLYKELHLDCDCIIMTLPCSE
jgi:D-xylose transport system substrate-binding protein